MDFEIDSTVPHQLTPEITFLRGGVGLWQYSIPFFTTNVPLSYAAEHFKLFEDLAQADTGEWTLEELFQRDISWTRVESEILQYLNNASRPQFFNALTIALLPSGLAEFGAEHGEALALPKILGGGLGEPIGVGGIQIQYYGSDTNVERGAGKLRWATSSVDAVAVDGQHRLAAIKRFVKQTKPSVWEKASIPVIFVIADERVGFRTPHAVGEKLRTVGALRALFIDLNKNARPVSHTRNILLDDLDIVSVATRSLIGKSLGSADEPERIPLALVDWLTDRNKIEDGPFVTTVMLLEEAMKRLLQVPNPQLDEDDDSVARVGTWLDRALPPSSEIEREAIMNQVQACAMQQSPLTWLPDNIDALRANFERKWRPHLHTLFRKFRPYSELWSYAEEQGLIAPLFVNLYVAREVMPPSVGQDRSTRLIEAAKAETPSWSLKKRYEDPLKHVDGTIKRDSWAYKIVFQRALLRAFVDVLRDPGQFVEATADLSAISNAFVEAMNRLVDADATSLSYAPNKIGPFWAGSGLSTDGSIEFSNAGAERMRAWLLAFFVMSANSAVPPKYGDLGTVDNQFRPFEFLRRMFDGSSSSVAYKGMEKLAWARGLDANDPGS